MNNYVLVFLFSLLSSSALLAQNHDSVLINLSNSELKVFRPDGKSLYDKKFFNPKDSYTDLDGDSINEYLVVDSTLINKAPFFTIYVYNCADTFYLVDSIQSGGLAPFIENSEEEGSKIIVSGNPDFMQFNNDMNNIFLPTNCWRLKDDNIYLINDDIYDFYISENNDIIDYLDDNISKNSKNCASSTSLKPAVAAVYANYLSAGEKSTANQFLKKYYFCNDALQFQKEMDEIMKGYIGEN